VYCGYYLKEGIMKDESRYSRRLDIALLISLSFIIILFFSFRQFDFDNSDLSFLEIPIIIINTPLTKQLQRPPRPSRPQLPVEVDDDELLDNVTIQPTDIDQIYYAKDSLFINKPVDDEIYEFYAVSEKPKLIHKTSPQYPQLAQKAGVEGTVVVTVTIDKSGNVMVAKILKSIPILDEAALEAAKEYKFIPAKQRDKYVKVRMNIPFVFKFKN
jgi:protein TonB